MLATAAEARVQVCLMAMVVPHEQPCEMCRANDCSAWRWLPEPDDGAAGPRLGYCALIGRIDPPCRRARRRDRRPGVRRC